jgi:hypothetical protein
VVAMAYFGLGLYTPALARVIMGCTGGGATEHRGTVEACAGAGAAASGDADGEGMWAGDTEAVGAHCSGEAMAGDTDVDRGACKRGVGVAGKEAASDAGAEGIGVKDGVDIDGTCEMPGEASGHVDCVGVDAVVGDAQRGRGALDGGDDAVSSASSLSGGTLDGAVGGGGDVRRKGKHVLSKTTWREVNTCLDVGS